ncbi:hypothetical protein Peur_068992 [Populus x canadensis]
MAPFWTKQCLHVLTYLPENLRASMKVKDKAPAGFMHQNLRQWHSVSFSFVLGGNVAVGDVEAAVAPADHSFGKGASD